MKILCAFILAFSCSFSYAESLPQVSCDTLVNSALKKVGLGTSEKSLDKNTEVYNANIAELFRGLKIAEDSLKDAKPAVDPAVVKEVQARIDKLRPLYRRTEDLRDALLSISRAENKSRYIKNIPATQESLAHAKIESEAKLVKADLAFSNEARAIINFMNAKNVQFKYYDQTIRDCVQSKKTCEVVSKKLDDIRKTIGSSPTKIAAVAIRELISSGEYKPGKSSEVVQYQNFTNFDKISELNDDLFEKADRIDSLIKEREAIEYLTQLKLPALRQKELDERLVQIKAEISRFPPSKELSNLLASRRIRPESLYVLKNASDIEAIYWPSGFFVECSYNNLSRVAFGKANIEDLLPQTRKESEKSGAQLGQK